MPERRKNDTKRNCACSNTEKDVNHFLIILFQPGVSVSSDPGVHLGVRWQLYLLGHLRPRQGRGLPRGQLTLIPPRQGFVFVHFLMAFQLKPQSSARRAFLPSSRLQCKIWFGLWSLNWGIRKLSLCPRAGHLEIHQKE